MAKKNDLLLSSIRKNIAPGALLQTKQPASKTPVSVIEKNPEPVSTPTEERTAKKRGTLKNYAVHLSMNEESVLNDLDLWLRGQGIKASQNSILRAGLRLMKKDFTTVDQVKAIKEEDSRRRKS